MSNQARPSTQSASQRTPPSTSNGPVPMEQDQKPEVKAANYTDYRLVAAFDPLIKNNIMKFAPSSSKKINLNSFFQPVKLNRKDPWAIRKKAEEEKRKAQELKLKAEADISSETMTHEQDPPSASAAKAGRDDSLVAPGPAGSQVRSKSQAFKKKTKQVFIAADQTARMLRKEEYQSWLLEDGSMTGNERWVGRYESAGAATGSSADPSRLASKSSNTDASNYVVFRLDEAGEDFQVLPCHRFYRFTQRPNYDTLGADEAEAAYEKMQKPTTKEDVGRWFMRRRGANTSVPSSTNGQPPSVKREASAKSSSILDESKISFGPRSNRPQVEVISHVNGRRGMFTAVHGANALKDEDEEDEKPRLGQEGDFDEFDFNEDFADDEEGAGNLNDEAMEEDELRELEERMKKEMLAAGRAGDEERAREDMDLDKDDLFADKTDLTKEGKAVKKLLMRKENDVYESDDDVKNPYASEEDESDFEEVVPPPAILVPSPTDSKPLPSSRAGTPGPSPSNPTGLSAAQRSSSKLSGQKALAVKVDKVSSGPSSRAGTPSVAAQARALSPHLSSAAGNLSKGGKSQSRTNSPQASHSRAGSPTISSSKAASSTSASAGQSTSSGIKRKHAGSANGKDKRPNPSLPGSPMPDQGVGLITEQEVINLLRNRTISTKELLSYFKLRLKEDRNKTVVFTIIKSVAQMVGGQLVLKDGF